MLNLLGFLLIGLAAGWLAGRLTRGQGFGWAGNLIIGVIGAAVGGLVFRLLGLATTGSIGELVAATVGAVLLLYLIPFIRRR